MNSDGTQPGSSLEGPQLKGPVPKALLGRNDGHPRWSKAQEPGEAQSCVRKPVALLRAGPGRGGSQGRAGHPSVPWPRAIAALGVGSWASEAALLGLQPPSPWKKCPMCLPPGRGDV